MAFRINGIGVAHLGIGPTDEHATAWSTLWFTFLWAPIFPIRRERLRFLPHNGPGYRYQKIASGPLNATEVLQTYLHCWCAVPAFLFLPAVPLSTEIWRDRLHLPDDFQIAAILLWIAWLVFWVWRIMDRFEAERRPVDTRMQTQAASHLPQRDSAPAAKSPTQKDR